MPDTTTDLDAWLLEQIDADVQVIRVACTYSHETFARSGADDWSLRRDPIQPESVAQVWASIGALRAHFTGITAPTLSNVGRYLETFDPERALAGCDAKRRIIEHVAEQQDSAYGELGTFLPPEWLDVLKLLALPYSDRPGYRPEWRPE